MNNDKRAHKNLVAANGSGEMLGLLETIDEQEEASAIVSSIEKEIKLNKRTFNKFSVLYRTNAQSRALEESFIRQGIPYNIIGSVRFYERKEVKNVLAYLRLVVNLKDTIIGFNVLVDGDFDDIPEAAFYMVGTIEEAIEKSKKMKK